MSHTVEKQQGLDSLRLALGVYVLLFALKLAAYFYTGVVALLAEALHTLSDIAISGFLLVAAGWSRKAADEDHMFGHGRAQNVAALIAATLFISVTSIQLYQESIPRIVSPGAASHQNLGAALGVVGVSALFALAPLISLIRQRGRGAAAQAQMMELINDELGLLAVLVGTLFVAAGFPVADPIAATAIATLIAVNALGLLRENASLLVGRSPGPEFLRHVTEVARDVPGVVEVHDLRAEYIGPETVRASLHIQVPRGIPIEEADDIAEEVQQRLREATGCDYCTVHLDPTPEDKSEAAA